MIPGFYVAVVLGGGSADGKYGRHPLKSGCAS
jgi:hypothetical protein